MSGIGNADGTRPEPSHLIRGVPGWSSLATDSTHVPVTAVVEAVADAMIDVPLDWIVSERIAVLYGADAKATLGTLGSGYPGLALFYSYLYRCGFGDRYAEVAHRYLEKSFAVLEEFNIGRHLISGMTGIAWAAANIQRTGLDCIDNSTFEMLDECVAQFTVDALASEIVGAELLEGVVGFGIYFLERPLTPQSVDLLRRIVDWLAATAEAGPAGVTWLTKPKFIIQHEGFTFPDGYYNLGVAHGVPGIAAFLSSVYAAGIARQTTRDLVAQSGRWVLSQRIPFEFEHAIPGWLEPNDKYDPARYGMKLTRRTGWCYGQMGVAAALLLAGQNIGDEQLTSEAYIVGLASARRGPTSGMAAEAGLCHGATGRALLLNRMYHLTGDREFQTQARLSVEKALEWRVPGTGIAGYTTIQPLTEEVSEKWKKPEAGLLNGAAGVGLGLLASLGICDPSWDRFMAISSRALDADEGYVACPDDRSS